MPKTVHLCTPISEEQIRDLQIDDIVYLSGEAYCMLYADHYTLILDKLDQGEPIPMNLKDGIIYNTGAIWRHGKEKRFDLRAIGATTSSKFNAQTPAFIEKTGIRVIIGKGGMDSACLNAMKQFGCVYLAIVGGCSAIYTPKAEIVDEFWPELMPTDNQRLKFQLKEFGPLFVAMDAAGNSIYKQYASVTQDHLPSIYSALGIE